MVQVTKIVDEFYKFEIIINQADCSFPFDVTLFGVHLQKHTVIADLLTLLFTPYSYF